MSTSGTLGLILYYTFKKVSVIVYGKVENKIKLKIEVVRRYLSLYFTYLVNVSEQFYWIGR